MYTIQYILYSEKGPCKTKQTKHIFCAHYGEKYKMNNSIVKFIALWLLWAIKKQIFTYALTISLEIKFEY